MRLRNMLKICLVFCKSEPRYAYKRYACKKNMYSILSKFVEPRQSNYLVKIDGFPN